MKRSTLYGAFLTLLMFWLVVVAIVVFLFQARSTLNQQVADLNAENRTLDDAVAARDNQLATTQSEQALTVQDLSTREAELADAQATSMAQAAEIEGQSNALAALSGDVANAQATASALQAEQEAARAEPPQVSLISPTEFDDLNPGEEVLIIFSASDQVGVNRIALGINDDVTLYEADGEPLLTVSVPWTPEEEGQYTIAVSAVDVDDQNSIAIELVVNVIDEQAVNDAIRAQVEANVTEIRGLEPLQPVVPTLLTRAELTERVNNDFFEDFTPEDAADEMLVYCVFDFGPCDFDYYNFVLGFYSGGVAGFYDPETAEFVVISEGGVLTPSEQWTHAHEFMHALQDQHFDLGQLSDESIDSEARFALRALAEGEAELLQALYIPYFSDEEIEQIRNSFNGDNPFEGAPPIFQETIFFPYSQGFDFVETLYFEGGNNFSLIDEAWASPPQSTEHILHPERYLAGDEPIIVSTVALTDTVGTGWRLLDEDILGEFVLWRYLDQGVAADIAADAAEGWGGDRFAVYYNDATTELVMTLRTVWDTEDDNTEFLEAYEIYGNVQFGAGFEPEDFPEAIVCWQPEGGLTCLISEDELTTTIIRAPSLEMVEAIWAEMQ